MSVVPVFPDGGEGLVVSTVSESVFIFCAVLVTECGENPEEQEEKEGTGLV